MTASDDRRARHQPAPSVDDAARAGGRSATSGVPARPNPLPPPRPDGSVSSPLGGLSSRLGQAGSAAGSTGPAATAGTGPRTSAGATRTPPSSRPVSGRNRRARLTLKRIDPWSVFLYSVVASIFVGIALLVAVFVLFQVLTKLGVISSLNTLLGDVTSQPGQAATPSTFFSAGNVLSVAAVVAAIDVVLLTAMSTLGAFLYNVCAALTGGIEVTLGDRD